MRSVRTAPLPSDEEVHAATEAAAAAYQRCRVDANEAARLAAEDDAVIESDEPMAMACLHASRMIESAGTSLMGNNVETGGRFLHAMAAGAERSWPPSERATQQARRLRTELIALFGAERTNALLRCTSRDGRLFPGLASKVEGPIVNSEKQQYTPWDEAERLFAEAAKYGVGT